MGSNRFYATLFVLSLATVAATAQILVPDSGALTYIDLTTAQKQTVYQSVAKT